MSSAAVQTIWAELLAATLADAGVGLVAISPGSRSTPLVAALAREPRLRLVTLIDERAAAFFALGFARATNAPAALVCTSGSAAAHYLPALVEASHARVPLVAITADRPPELHACGASQTIDQTRLYGAFARGAFDLGAPADGALALRALRRTLVQAVTLARGPLAGPVHVNAPLRKPLEPVAPSTEAERALARIAHELGGPVRTDPPRTVPAGELLEALATAIHTEPRGVIVAGALPAHLDRDAVLALAARAGYPIVAETGSQLRFGPRRGATIVERFDLIPTGAVPAPRLIVQLGAEPVAAAWPGWLASVSGETERWVLAEAWHDPEGTARVVLGNPAEAIASTAPRDRAGSLATADWLSAWRTADARANAALETALAAHPGSEVAIVRAAVQALPPRAALQIGNSLPIRVVDHAAGDGPARPVHTQRGAAGIDGLVASAAGATHAGAPLLLILGDVSFAHDLGGLLAARAAAAPLAILVIDNGGGQIFSGLPAARAGLGDAFARHWTTPTELDIPAVAAALGARAIVAESPAAVAAAVAAALDAPHVTVIHAPASATGAHDVRRAALESYTRRTA